MRKARFTVPGNAVGFKTTTKRSKHSEDYQKYVDYKKLVQLHAKASGIRLPLVATKDRPLTIRTVAYFKNGNHPDPGNVQKGVTDALFYDADKVVGKRTRKGNDKYTGGSFPPPLYDKDNPRVVVIIKDYQPKKRKKNGQEQKEPGKKRSKRPKEKTRAKRAQGSRKGAGERSKGSKKNDIRNRRTRR